MANSRQRRSWPHPYVCVYVCMDTRASLLMASNAKASLLHFVEYCRCQDEAAQRSQAHIGTRPRQAAVNGKVSGNREWSGFQSHAPRAEQTMHGSVWAKEPPEPSLN